MGVGWAARFRFRANSRSMTARPRSGLAVTNGFRGLNSRRTWRRSSKVFDDLAAVEARGWGAAAVRFIRVAFVGAIELCRRRLRTSAADRLFGDLIWSSAAVCFVRGPLTNTIEGRLAILPAWEPQGSPRVKARAVLTTRPLLKCPPAALAGPSPVTLTRRAFARPALCAAPAGEDLRKIKDDQYIERHIARVGSIHFR